MTDRGGDPEGGYDEFFDACLPVVLGVVGRLTASRADAEDVAVEALGRAFADWPRLGVLPYRQAWVVRVATNLVLADRRRARRLRPELPPPSAADVGDTVALQATLLTALRRLPRRQREAVVLRYLADLPEAEVAALLGVTSGSVKTHVHRGLRSLRSALGHSEQGDGLDVRSI
jgi:RNA polymerase sigma-70 factor (sigma-E family)